MRTTTWQQWVVFTCGIIVFILGLFVFTVPKTTIYVVGILAGIGMLVEGISKVVKFAKGGHSFKPSGLVLFSGFIDFIFGVMVLLNIKSTAIVLCFLIGFWFLFGSVMRIARSFELKMFGIKKWWITLLLGIVSTILSFYVIWNPIVGAAVIVICASIALITSGIMMIAGAFSERMERE